MPGQAREALRGRCREGVRAGRPGAGCPARGADADDDAGIPAAGDRAEDRPALGADHRVVPVPLAEEVDGRADPDRSGHVRDHAVRPRGRPLAKERLSEGEKQIFAISVLWGLARASNRPLPAVIDTPMARLDATHRRNLVEQYFPNASHQVVILSTDTEVDRDYYEALQPHIARAYHLNYDEDERVTVAEEGYFWKDSAHAASGAKS